MVTNVEVVAKDLQGWINFIYTLNTSGTTFCSLQHSICFKLIIILTIVRLIISERNVKIEVLIVSLTRKNTNI